MGTLQAGTDLAAIAWRDAPAEDDPGQLLVARFIGGHNALPGEGGLIAIRADHCRLGTAGSGQYLSGRVEVVEYQGSLVRVALDTELGGQATALMADKLFYADPV